MCLMYCMCLSYSYYFDTVSCKILKTYRPSFPLWKSKKPFTGIWLPGNCLPSPLLGSNCPWAQLFSFSFLRCHNGGEPDVDKGEMGVIKSEPRAARHRCHTYGVVMSLRHCRRMLLFFSTNKGMLLVRQQERHILNTDSLTPTDRGYTDGQSGSIVQEGVCVSAREATAEGGMQKKIDACFLKK